MYASFQGPLERVGHGPRALGQLLLLRAVEGPPEAPRGPAASGLWQAPLACQAWQGADLGYFRQIGPLIALIRAF